MKYYRGSIEERNGDLEYDTPFILAFDENKYSLEQASMLVTQQWRSGDEDDWDEIHQGFWSDCSLIFPFEWDFEVPPEELEIAKKYVAVVGLDEEDE